ncbi:MAG: hypothetical protein QM764_20620 [Chitinophagaceae bacterium]
MEANKQALINYMVNVLEPKNEAFGNLPMCPFVKKERLKNRILFEKVIFGAEPGDQVISLISSTFAHTDENTLLAFDTDTTLGLDEFIEYGKKLCDLFSRNKIISIALHPLDNFNIHGHFTRKVPFPTLLVQTARQISAAKTTLMATQYYKFWTKEDLDNNFEQFAKYL